MPIDYAFPLATLSAYWPLMLAALAAGLVDSMGGGGGLITVPTLLNLGVPPVFLLGTNKIISCLGSLPALYRYRKARLLPHLGWRIWALLFLICALAAALGAFFSQNHLYLSRITLIVPLLLVFVMAFMVKRWFFDEKNPRRLTLPNDSDLKSHLLLKLKNPLTPLGLVAISFYDGILGPGAGAFFMNFLEHLHIKTLTANAITKVFNLASNLGALVFFTSQDKALWSLGLSGAFAYSFGNYLGAGIVLKKGQGLVRGVVLSVTTLLLIRTVYRYFNA